MSFELEVIDDGFKGWLFVCGIFCSGKSQLVRQRSIHEILGPKFMKEVHAVIIRCRTREENDARGEAQRDVC